MNQSCWINIHRCANERHTTFVWGVGIITYMAVIGHFSTIVNVQMKVDASLHDDGMNTYTHTNHMLCWFAHILWCKYQWLLSMLMDTIQIIHKLDTNLVCPSFAHFDCQNITKHYSIYRYRLQTQITHTTTLRDGWEWRNSIVRSVQMEDHILRVSL